VVKNLFSVGL